MIVVPCRAPSLALLLGLSSASTLPLLAGAARSHAAGKASAILAAGEASTEGVCEKWLLVQYREHPSEETEGMPLRGSFYYPAGDWTDKFLMAKSLAKGCAKFYTAVCAEGKGGLQVVSWCPTGDDGGSAEKKTRSFSVFSSSRKTDIGKGESVELTLPDGSLLQLKSGLVKVTAMSPGKCPVVETQKAFDLMAYISKPWYVQQQMVTKYLPETWNNCVVAKYELMDKDSFWGYTIRVRNLARETDGTVHDSGSLLRAYNADKFDPAKLAVAPSFIPKAFAGDYWVLAHNEEEGYALVSGGQPTKATEDGCRTGSGTNDAGLWIFTRARERDDALVQKVRGLAAAQGFDLSVLKDVDQTNCADVVVP